MKVTTTHTTWTCDGCRKTVVGDSQPSGHADPWGTLMVKQPSGFDTQGCAWAPRMREPLLMCGACIEIVVAVVNKLKAQPERKEN